MPGILRKIQGFFMERPPNFSMVTDFVAASGLPSTRKHIQYLRKIGVTAIISLTENPLPGKLLDGTDIKYFHFPLEDHQPADPRKIHEIVKTLQKLVNEREKVLVHCLAGLGRTGMVLTAYVMAEEKNRWRESLEKVRNLRPGSVEPNQEKTLEEFEKLVTPDF
ncbi:MAG: dual specificity protein phosphatase family protein [Candidatus Caldarchaeum sp.]|nr:dual specificity protein phosphatase family protein [Candidatus Caldarchaeum sp.]